MAYFKDRSWECRENDCNGDWYYEIFSKYGTTYAFAECDGFCHVCWQGMTCEYSRDADNEWRRMYS